ncbi:Transglutaminase-like superfamily protein [Nonlabens sp. Hel1_33_55]|uniref:DUF3857 domain-containing protein n=1 Tax=Nonlabens sp. Hel1_33_55 TaxID=1336802 RepID=UPI000875AC4A|nr:DUF3857 domain-containing protein [Nonlabens sp. Hel1_33_55]SCY43729.1 Transglutaminase-like superfamily protein [Nonlabens sp. Hel1_33_55]
MNKITQYPLLLLLLFTISTQAQLDSKLISITIPQKLTTNANAVIRQNDVVVEVNDIDDVTVTEDRIVTVFNKTGMNYINAHQNYSDSWDIKDMRAVIYDALGNEITTIKERDFRDVSAVDSGTLYADNRVKYLEYTARTFPITVHYTSEVEMESTAFLPQWLPLENFYCSTESSSIQIINNSDTEVKFKEQNFDSFSIEKLGDLHYVAKDLVAIKNEAYRPGFKSFAPVVKFAMKNFVMEGVEGVNNSWQDFGKWMHDDLLVGTQELPDEVKQEIKSLTSNATTDIEKAKIVYEYVQDRSRYISVQVGIGGWKPIEAVDVHKMAYGDCKGLTNYTMALMNEVGVKSNYAAIYGGSEKRSMDREFSMTEGNHVILYLPELEENKDYWLECTSKTAPFGFMSDFTDDRDALVITPEGGKLVHTTSYDSNKNLQKTLGQFQINENGRLTGKVNIESEGVQYAWRNRLESQNSGDLKNNYLEQWDHLNGLFIIDAINSSDKSIPRFIEDVQLEIASYGSKTGNLLLFQPVILNRNTSEPPVYSDRRLDFEIDRGYIDQDIYEIQLDEGVSVDALPNPVNIKSNYGEYDLKLSQSDNGNIVVERRLEILAGMFDKKEYEEYRKFRSEVVKHDSSKRVLKIN